MDPLVRWQHCTIPQCENLTDLVSYAVELDIVENRTIIEDLMSPTFIVLAAGVGVGVVIVLLLISLICSKLCRSGPGYTATRIQDGDIDLEKLAENSNYQTTGS
ncbi:tyrosine-protein kinase transmembrane receptor Ror2 [Eurytemora carolleeae]|uniref:tyrosine-protein kinase transmembrane receptor Ror2 n=1 Tax=Eurytemora carolleeae TaxID=1294199 RepID=UPI000C75A456|nr:tyrosine-protein kinase transmembrane receptor Ror2 [Eurytemora carolleeae]|eukprot:XP_023341939.1 tyrosine-protein kinase transmembrane receptor Ror2-like [Eurytemora affinis]